MITQAPEQLLNHSGPSYAQSVKVSVIIPAYNASRTVADTLGSLLAQTYREWEAIVVDDGSEDATPEIVARFAMRDPRISLIRQPNGGESAARNTGVAKARNEWLLFLDADDWISPNHLQRLTAEILSKPELDAVHCGSVRVALDGTQVSDQYQAPAGDMFSTLARRAAFPINACIVRKSLVESVGKFDTSLKKSADWDLWQRIARTGAQFGAVREVLAFYRMQPNSASLDAEQLLRDGLCVLRRGHSIDPRVSNPHPEHVKGLPQCQIQNQEFYLLCWCAGLLLGCGKDARRLLTLVGNDQFEQLYPPAVAQCIFEAATLPTCRSPKAWEKLWYLIQPQVEEFLLALETQSKARDLASRTMTSLKRMILKHSSSWGLIIQEYEQEKNQLEGSRVHWQTLAEERQQQSAKQLVLLDQWQETDKRWKQWEAEQRRKITEQENTIEEQKTAINELRISINALQVAREVLTAANRRLEGEKVELGETLKLLEREREELYYSFERRIGDLLVNRLKLWRVFETLESVWATCQRRIAIIRLSLDRLFTARKSKFRIIASVCDKFPIYSQTFVYQELTELARNRFDLRLLYSKPQSREYLAPDFGRLWRVRRRLHLNRSVHERDFEAYRRRIPDKVENLIQRICKASGMTSQELLQHDNFLQAFTFTRLVEAYRPHYLHSYFFYDRSLMTMIAGYLLNIPRGISCYADHLLKDYELKVVPLHLELCDVVIATSAKIKQELIEIAPEIDPNRIIVKPNAIDAKRFPRFERTEPEGNSPYRLLSVCRLEPKKGLIYLIEAVEILKKRELPVELHIVGAVDEWSVASRDYKNKIDRRLSELNLWGTIHLEGRHNLSGILKFHRLAHLFVAPFVETEAGDKDGIPTALLEALATGLPAVATETGSIPEVIENGVNGVLIPPRDPIALADAIETLLRDPARRAQFGSEAAEKVRRHYEIGVCESIFHQRLRNIVTMGK